MTASHHDDGTGTDRWMFQGHDYPTRKAMCEARRAEYVRLLAEEGMNLDWLQCIRQSDEGRMTWNWRPTMDDPKHPRHYDEAFKRQIVQSCESGKPSLEIRPSMTSRDRPAALGPRHPQQRLHPALGYRSPKEFTEQELVL